MSIQNYLNQVKNAIFGKDVRQAIYDAIKQCYDDASVNNDNANMEVKIARGVYSNLNDRLTVQDNNLRETISKLDIKANENEVRLKKDAIELKDLHTEVKQAMTGGSVAVVGLNAVGTENLKDKSIRNSKVQRVGLSKIVNTVIDPTLFTIWNKGSSDSIETSDNGITFTKATTGDRGPMSEIIRPSEDIEFIYVSYEYMGDGHTLWLFKENGTLSTSIAQVSQSSTKFNTYTVKIPRSILEAQSLLNGFRLVWAVSGDANKILTVKNICVNDNGLKIDIVDEIINMDGSRIKDKTVSGTTLKDDSIETNHLKSNCITNSKISDVDISKIYNNLLPKYNFGYWGGSANSNLVIGDEIHYSTTTNGDKGIVSNTVDLYEVEYSNIYISIIAKSNTRLDASLFNEAGGYKTGLGNVVYGTEDISIDEGYRLVQYRISKDKLVELGISSKFKIVLAIHNIGEFFIKDIVVNTNGSAQKKLSDTIEDIYIKMDNPDLNVKDIKNIDSDMFSGRDMVTWGTPTTFQYNEEDNTIDFSYTPTNGNAGFMTKPFRYYNDYKLEIVGEVIELSNGKLNIYIKGKSLVDGSIKYYSYQLISKIGPFYIKLDMEAILNGRDPIDMNSIEILIANSGVTTCKLKDFKIINNIFPFEGETLLDILTNLKYEHIKSVDTVIADIYNSSDFLHWAGGSHTISNGQIQFDYPSESGNGGVRTIDFTSKTNFIVIEGEMTSITKHSSTSKMQIYICGKKISDGSNTYLTVSQLNDVTSFRHIVDLNYHVVYNDLDLTKPVYVLFGSVGMVSATFKNIRIFENELGQVELIGDNLADTLINIDSAISSIKSEISGLGNNNILIAPNGEKFILQVSNEGVLSTAPIIPNKVLFIGNSLLNGHGTFGMCATDSKNDYFYHMKEYLKTFNSEVICNKIHGAVWEQAESKSAADNWVTNNIKNQDTDYDLVIVQLGDNVNNEARNELFKTSCKELLQTIRNYMPGARVAWAGEWYGTAQRQEIIANACSETGSIFIDISDLTIKANQGSIGDIITADNGTQTTVTSSGVASHPGNKGMKAIADRLIEKLFN